MTVGRPRSRSHWTDRWYTTSTYVSEIKRGKKPYWACILCFRQVSALNLVDGTLCLPDEVRIGLAGRRPPYSSNISAVNLNDWHVSIPAGKSTDVRVGINPLRSKLWVKRDVAWVPTVTVGPINYALVDYKRRYTRYGAKLWCPVGLMNDREHDTSISRICVGWIKTV